MSNINNVALTGVVNGGVAKNKRSNLGLNSNPVLSLNLDTVHKAAQNSYNNNLGSAQPFQSSTPLNSTNTSDSQGRSFRPQGFGAFDVLAKPFTANKYGEERHARSLDPWHLGQGYNFAGPGTELKTRAELGDDKPLNSLDRAAKEHDYAYAREGKGYNADWDVNKHMQNVWESDKEFMYKSFMNRDDPIMGTVASGMIGAKMLGEKLGLLSPETFSGIGVGKRSAYNTFMGKGSMKYPEMIPTNSNRKSNSLTQPKLANNTNPNRAFNLGINARNNLAY